MRGLLRHVDAALPSIQSSTAKLPRAGLNPMQPTSLLVAFASVPRRQGGHDSGCSAAAPGDAPNTTSRWIRLRVAVTSSQVLALRQWLHQVIGHSARVYIVEVDARRGQATVHIELEDGAHDAAMHALVTAVPTAGFDHAANLMDEPAPHRQRHGPQGKRRHASRCRPRAMQNNVPI